MEKNNEWKTYVSKVEKKIRNNIKRKEIRKIAEEKEKQNNIPGAFYD